MLQYVNKELDLENAVKKSVKLDYLGGHVLREWKTDLLCNCDGRREHRNNEVKKMWLLDKLK